MKKNLLITLFILHFQIGYGQHQIYFGLYSAGQIEQYYAVATAPYYKDLNYYTVSFMPKIGYRYKRIMAGFIGAYTFHHNTFQNLEPTWGGGYFLKYHFSNVPIKHIPFKCIADKLYIQWFVEWRQLLNDGYYERVLDWRMAKVSTQSNLMTAHIGGDISFNKAFSVSIGTGVGAIQFLKDTQNPAAGKRYAIRPASSLSLQYYFKL